MALFKHIRDVSHITFHVIFPFQLFLVATCGSANTFPLDSGIICEMLFAPGKILGF